MDATYICVANSALNLASIQYVPAYSYRDGNS